MPGDPPKRAGEEPRRRWRAAHVGVGRAPADDTVGADEQGTPRADPEGPPRLGEPRRGQYGGEDRHIERRTIRRSRGATAPYGEGGVGPAGPHRQEGEPRAA